jgi:hypothetical protein
MLVVEVQVAVPLKDSPFDCEGKMHIVLHKAHHVPESPVSQFVMVVLLVSHETKQYWPEQTMVVRWVDETGCIPDACWVLWRCGDWFRVLYHNLCKSGTNVAHFVHDHAADINSRWFHIHILICRPSKD